MDLAEAFDDNLADEIGGENEAPARRARERTCS